MSLRTTTERVSMRSVHEEHKQLEQRYRSVKVWECLSCFETRPHLDRYEYVLLDPTCDCGFRMHVGEATETYVVEFKQWHCTTCVSTWNEEKDVKKADCPCCSPGRPVGVSAPPMHAQCRSIVSGFVEGPSSPKAGRPGHL